MKLALTITIMLACISTAEAKNTGVNGHTGMRLVSSPRQVYPEDRHIAIMNVCRHRVSACEHG